MYTVYLDLDGVICDFDGAYNKIAGGLEFNKPVFETCVYNFKIFERLDRLPGYYEIMKIINSYSHGINFEILSSLAAPNDQRLSVEVSRQKIKWLRDNELNFYHTNFVTHKGLKKRFANPNSALIDDTKQNIYDFNECHGTGILYTRHNKAIENLKTLCENRYNQRNLVYNGK